MATLSAGLALGGTPGLAGTIAAGTGLRFRWADLRLEFQYETSAPQGRIDVAWLGGAVLPCIHTAESNRWLLGGCLSLSPVWGSAAFVGSPETIETVRLRLGARAVVELAVLGPLRLRLDVDASYVPGSGVVGGNTYLWKWTVPAFTGALRFGVAGVFDVF